MAKATETYKRLLTPYSALVNAAVSRGVSKKLSNRARMLLRPYRAASPKSFFTPDMGLKVGRRARSVGSEKKFSYCGLYTKSFYYYVCNEFPHMGRIHQGL
jgi:hypothetical protein